MRHLRTFTTVLGSAATAGALLLATPGLAEAATYQTGNADHERVVRDADGDADGQARATKRGHFQVSGVARGGGEDPVIGGTNPVTRVNAFGELNYRVPAADGTYRVAIHYRGARGTDKDRAGGDADVSLRSTVRFRGSDGAVLNRNTEVGENRRDRVVRFSYKVPEGASGRLQIRAALVGTARAASESDFGRFSGSVKAVQITVNRVGD